MRKNLRNLFIGSAMALVMAVSPFVGTFGAVQAEAAVTTKAAVVAKAPVKTTIKAKDLYTKIMKGIENPSMMPLDAGLMKDAYGIDAKLLDSYYIMTPLMNVQATEYAVFRVKSTKDIAKIKTGINKRLKYLNDLWSTYLPNQYELVQKAKITVKGNYVLLTISENQDKIIKAFNANVK